MVTTSWATNFTSGTVGVGVFQNNAGSPDCTLDDFKAHAPAPSVVLSGGSSNVNISWPAQQEGIWVLESTSTLGGTWTEVPFNTISFSNGQFVYTETSSTGNNFFRLRKV